MSETIDYDPDEPIRISVKYPKSKKYEAVFTFKTPERKDFFDKIREMREQGEDANVDSIYLDYLTDVEGIRKEGGGEYSLEEVKEGRLPIQFMNAMGIGFNKAVGFDSGGKKK